MKNTTYIYLAIICNESANVLVVEPETVDYDSDCGFRFGGIYWPEYTHHENRYEALCTAKKIPGGMDIMKDINDKTTVDGFKTRGRPRKYANAAERQKAYRENKKSKEIDIELESEKLYKMCLDHKNQEETATSDYMKKFHRNVITGIKQAWIGIFIYKMDTEEFEQWETKFESLSRH